MQRELPKIFGLVGVGGLVTGCLVLSLKLIAPIDCSDTIRFIQGANSGRVSLNASEKAQLQHQIDLKGKTCENIGLPLPPLATRSPYFPKP